jgi:hypothetical protein
MIIVDEEVNSKLGEVVFGVLVEHIEDHLIK